METVFNDITDYLLRQSWQIALLFAIVAIVCLAIRKKSAHLRYLVCEQARIEQYHQERNT